MSRESFMSRTELLGCAKDIVAAIPGARVELADGTEIGTLDDGRIFVDEPTVNECDHTEKVTA